MTSATLRLIVHADDFGMAEAVNGGILEAHDCGIVTSTSIMATGPRVRACRGAREEPA